jgi:hypothetical protein
LLLGDESVVNKRVEKRYGPFKLWREELQDVIWNSKVDIAVRDEWRSSTYMHSKECNCKAVCYGNFLKQ